MRKAHVLFGSGGPVAVFGSSAAAMRAILDLPSWVDAESYLVSVPFEPRLSAAGGTLAAAPGAGERRVSAAAGPGPVVLSPNGNKKE